MRNLSTAIIGVKCKWRFRVKSERTEAHAYDRRRIIKENALLLEALRNREEEIFQLFADSGPALAGFGWALFAFPDRGINRCKRTGFDSTDSP